MARRRRKPSFKTSLKFEVYGILIITLSVIALAGEARVGRSLSKLFGLLIGNFYFIIPVFFIYIGLYLMIQRKWPRGWSIRQWGLCLIGLATVTLSSVSGMNLKLGTVESYSASAILKQTNLDLYGELFAPPEHERPMLKMQIRGGYVGAVSHSLLYLLFGNTGTKLILLMMYAIGISLLTGLSYVDMIRKFRSRAAHLAQLIQRKWVLAHSNRPARTSRDKQVHAEIVDPSIDDDLAAEAESYIAEPPKKRQTPLFFQLFKSDSPSSDRTERSAEVREAINEDAADEPAFHEDNEQLQQPVIDEELYSEADDEQIPVITDFQEHIDQDSVERSVESIEEIPDEDQPVDSDLEDGEEASEERPVKPYLLPPLHLLTKPASAGRASESVDYKSTARKLEATLESFGVRAKVLAVVRGPSVTRFEVQPDIGVKVSRIVNLTDDIALALAAKDIRMEAPIPGKSAIGIEVPNTEVSVVTLREVMESSAFQDAASNLSIALGRDISGQPIIGNLARMPHLLVAGATGSGKSVCINNIITSILYKAKPDEVKFLMIDPKMVELNVYNGIPHLIAPVVTDPKRASLALKKIVVEMEKRYELFSKSATRNIEGYNNLMADNPDALLPYIVVIVDELADLMMVAANDVEDAIIRLAQMARAAGIHLIIATQRPSVDVITGVIKANIPSRIAFSVSSQVDSRTILDMAGAEKLLGRGDMLFLPVGASKPIRVQGANLSDQEVEAVVQFARDQEQAEYKPDIVPEIEESADDMEPQDELYDQAVQIVLEAKQASVSLLQRRMRIGYTRAARLIDSMEARGIIGPYEGSKPREVLLSMEQYQQNRISS